MFILVFFTVYAASCFVTCGKLFSTLFGYSYHSMMIVGALFVIFYTFIGGFLAESASDFMQAIVMVFALVVILVTGTINAGGIDAGLENAKAIPGYFSLTSIATPWSTPRARSRSSTAWRSSVRRSLTASSPSFPAWLGAWATSACRRVLLRFMAIRDERRLKQSRRIATVWVIISLFAAVMIGVIGRALLPGRSHTEYGKLGRKRLYRAFGILAARNSRRRRHGRYPGCDDQLFGLRYLLIAASAFAKDLYGGIFKKNATDKQVMRVTRIILILISLIGIVIAWDENSVIFSIVSFAWAGFGATFGPIMLFSLFWKRTTRAGAVAGMITGGVMVFVWNLLISPLWRIFAIYELLPAFLLSSIVIVVVVASYGQALRRDPEGI